jgi:hypothetical protein
VPERKHLEAAGVGEDRVRPGHEPVQAAERGDPLGAGPEVQVVRVAEHDLGPQRLQLVRQHGLDGGLRADRHEDGRRHRAVGGVQHAGAGGAGAADDVEASDHRRSVASPKE